MSNRNGHRSSSDTYHTPKASAATIGFSHPGSSRSPITVCNDQRRSSHQSKTMTNEHRARRHNACPRSQSRSPLESYPTGPGTFVSDIGKLEGYSTHLHGSNRMALPDVAGVLQGGHVDGVGRHIQEGSDYRKHRLVRSSVRSRRCLLTFAREKALPVPTRACKWYVSYLRAGQQLDMHTT